jgi:hypothetical protein
MSVYFQIKQMRAKQCFCFDFAFGTAFGAIMLAVATGTTISCSLARQYGPVIGLLNKFDP